MCSGLTEACSYYAQYSQYSSSNPDQNPDCMKYLRLLINNPECTVYELETGKRPTHINRPVIGDVGESIAVDDDADYAIEMVDDFEIEVEVFIVFYSSIS